MKIIQENRTVKKEIKFYYLFIEFIVVPEMKPRTSHLLSDIHDSTILFGITSEMNRLKAFITQSFFFFFYYLYSGIPEMLPYLTYSIFSWYMLTSLLARSK